MISKARALEIVEQEMPEYTVQAGPIPYQDLYLFSLYNDGLGGDLDPFYSINKKTGVFQGFTVLDKLTEVLPLFEGSLEHSDYLAHYGVLGMKWGVRKDGKPQGYQGPSRASVKAQKIIDNPLVKMPLSVVVPRTSASSLAVSAVTSFLSKSQGMSVSDAVSETAKGLLTDKKTQIGLAITALDSGAYRVPTSGVKTAATGGWKKDPALAKKNMSVSEIKDKVVKGINPDFPGLGTTNNCLRCTYTYEMRRRGYDVSATKTIFASGQTKIGQKTMSKSLSKHERIYSDPDASKIKRIFLPGKADSTAAFKRLAKEPNGSRGEFSMTWGPLMGGHSIAYEVVNNKPVFIDAQSGKTFENPRELDSLLNHAETISFNRLDNKDLNSMTIPAWIKNNKR